MAVDFSKILAKQANEIEKPKPLPIGDYLAVNPKLPDFKGIGKNETPCAEFGLTVIVATDTVDPDHLAEYGEVKGKTIRHRMFLTEATEYRTKEELENAFGIDPEGKNLGQMFNETVNKQVLVTIGHRPSEDGTEIYAEVTGIAQAE
jgi:hypothetical protein